MSIKLRMSNMPIILEKSVCLHSWHKIYKNIYTKNVKYENNIFALGVARASFLFYIFILFCYEKKKLNKKKREPIL